MKKLFMVFVTGVMCLVFMGTLPKEDANLTSDETIPLVRGNTMTAAVTQTAKSIEINEKNKQPKLEKPKNKKKVVENNKKQEASIEKIAKVEEIIKPAVEEKVVEVTPLDALLKNMTEAQTARSAIKAVINIKSNYGEEPAQLVTGDIIIKKDKKFYIHYKQPTEQFMISNGKTLWVYTPEMNQVMTQDLSKAAPNARFYVELENSIAYYAKKSINTLTEESDYYMLSMKPKDKKLAQYDEIICRIEKKDYFPDSMTMKAEEVVMEVKFSEVVKFTKEQAEKEPDLKNTKFNFIIPKGVEEIEAEAMLESIENMKKEKTPVKSGKEK